MPSQTQRKQAILRRKERDWTPLWLRRNQRKSQRRTLQSRSSWKRKLKRTTKPKTSTLPNRSQKLKLVQMLLRRPKRRRLQRKV
jgi:hypothetical protein